MFSALRLAADAPPPPVTQEKASDFYDLPENSQYDESHFWGELINMLVTLGCILLVLGALLWMMRRMQTSRIKYANETGLIKVIDHRVLSQKTSIYLLQIDQKAILIADTQNGTTHLAEFPLSDIGNRGAQATEGSSFKTIFNRKQNDKRTE